MPELRVRDVAARLNVSEKTVYKWLSQGLIPGTRIGRTWLITEEALQVTLHSGVAASQSPAISSGPRSSEQVVGGPPTDQAMATLQRVTAVATGAIQTGIDDVLLPRRSSEDTARAIAHALDVAEGEVLLQGIGLREFFGDQDYTPVLRRMLTEDRNVHVRALLVHPVGDFARARAVAEMGEQVADDARFRAGPLYGDSWRSLNVIASLKKAAGTVSNFSLDVRFVDHWPSMYLVITEKCCFVETYHFGRPIPAISGSSIEGLVPMLKVGAAAAFYGLLRSHFDYVWQGTNPYIRTYSLDEIADAMRVTV